MPFHSGSSVSKLSVSCSVRAETDVLVRELSPLSSLDLVRLCLKCIVFNAFRNLIGLCANFDCASCLV